MNWPTILGGKEFKKKIKEKYLGKEIDIKEVPDYRRDMIRTEQAEEDIKRLIANNQKILQNRRKRKHSEERRALVYLLRRCYDLSLREISEIMGGITYSAVSRQYKIAEGDVREKKGCYNSFEGMAKSVKFNFKT